MKKFFLFVAFFTALFFTACRKEIETTPDPAPQPGEPKPVIEYKQVNVVLSYQHHIEIELDGDNVYDFAFTSLQVVENNQFNLYLKVNSLEPGHSKFAIQKNNSDPLHGSPVYPFEKDSTISDHLPGGIGWNDEDETGLLIKILDTGGPLQYDGPWVGKYGFCIGVRIKKDSHFYYGWIRLNHTAGKSELYIEDMAYNKNPDQKIKAGQQIF